MQLLSPLHHGLYLVRVRVHLFWQEMQQEHFLGALPSSQLVGGRSRTKIHTCLTSLESDKSSQKEYRDVFYTHSFFLRAGKVGTNLSLCVPCLVTSDCFFARLPIALGALDDPACCEPEDPLSLMGELTCRKLSARIGTWLSVLPRKHIVMLEIIIIRSSCHRNTSSYTDLSFLSP